MWPFKVKPSKGHRYSWIPDHPDQRDRLYAVKRKAPSATLPPKMDLRSLCPPVQDQGQLGSCTAHAITSAVEVLEAIDKLPETLMSRLFVYYNERLIEGSVNQDTGAQVRDGIKSLVKYGVCPEKDWPYIIPRFTKNPSTQAYIDGAQHKITSYARLLTLNDMKSCLAAGYPFVFGFTVYESFESDVVAQTGIMSMPKPTERVLGGHCVMAVGYDDATQCLIVRNSWGPKWGHFG